MKDIKSLILTRLTILQWFLIFAIDKITVIIGLLSNARSGRNTATSTAAIETCTVSIRTKTLLLMLLMIPIRRRTINLLDSRSGVRLVRVRHSTTHRRHVFDMHLLLRRLLLLCGGVVKRSIRIIEILLRCRVRFRVMILMVIVIRKLLMRFWWWLFHRRRLMHLVLLLRRDFPRYLQRH